MKKAISLLLVLAMCLSFCACGGVKAPNANNYDETQQETENSTTITETIVDITTDNTELIKEWEDILFNNVWYGKSHGREDDEEVKLVFNKDGSCDIEGSPDNTWEFIGFYEDGAEYMATAPIWQTTPNYVLEKGLYVADDFTLGITEDGEYLLRTWYDLICYTQSQNEEA